MDGLFRGVAAMSTTALSAPELLRLVCQACRGHVVVLLGVVLPAQGHHWMSTRQPGVAPEPSPYSPSDMLEHLVVLPAQGQNWMPS